MTQRFPPFLVDVGLLSLPAVLPFSNAGDPSPSSIRTLSQGVTRPTRWRSIA